MSEILENNVCEVALDDTADLQISEENSVNEIDTPKVDVEQNLSEPLQDISVDVVDDNMDDSNQNGLVSNEKIEGFIDFIKEFSSKKQEIIDELESRKEYLVSNLVKYDSEDYFQNESFKNLYSSLFNKLGTELDTEKFINLIDSYVDSRIDSYSKNQSAKKENELLTEGFKFQAGASKKDLRKLRMQDIPDSELEKYIAKYI